MPDLPPVNEDFVANTSRYTVPLEAMAAVAEKAAAAQERLNKAIAEMQRLMDAAAAGASEAAAAESALAEAEQNVASGAAEAAAAEQAEAAATANVGKAAAAAGAPVWSLAKFQEALTAASLASAAAGRASANAADAARNAYMGLAAANVAATAEAEKLAEAQAAASLAAYQDAQQAKVLAGADAMLAGTQAAAAGAARSHADAEKTLAAALDEAEKNAFGLITPLTAITAANDRAGAAATRAAFGFRLWGTGIRLTGTALHWVVAGAAEFLAVAIPAAVALGAGLAVATAGAQNAYRHFTALYQATEATYLAFHQTVGSALGLGSALTSAQTAAKPGVYEVLGAAINSIKGSYTGLNGQLLSTQSGFMGLAQTGLQVVHMFDEFAARVTVDLGSGMSAQLHGMLSGMVTDLSEFGQILANLGHALLNFASAMPGLAAVLLAIATAVSRVVLAISSIPAPIITAVIAIEEFYRWGGLALNLLLRLGAAPAAFAAWLTGANFITNFGSALLKLVQWGGVAVQWVGLMITRLGTLIGVSGEAGAAIQAFGVAMTRLAISPLGMAGIALLVAGFGALIFAAARGQTAMQQWISTSDAMVAKASDLNVLNTIGQQLAATQVRLAAATQVEAAAQTHAAGEAHALVFRWVSTSEAAALASENIVNLTAHEQSLIDTGTRVIQNAANLGAVFHTSATGAMALAQAAGVNLQQAMARGTLAFAIAVQQIRNYITGIGAMGAPLGMLGADVMALGIQSQLAASKVQQLNQAWDAWIGTTTAAASSMAQVETALNGMSSAGLATSNRLTGAISSIDHATKGSTFTLHGFGQAAMQSWQQFTSAIGTGNSALDTLRIGMAEGVVTGAQFKATVQGLVGQMAPFTQGNAAAVQMLSQLAHEAGGPVTTDLKTLEHWAGVAGNTARDQFARGMLAASLAMGNMARVAQNLSAVVEGSLSKAMGTAIVANSGLNTAIQRYAVDLRNVHTPASILAADQRAIATAMSTADRMVATSSKGLANAAAAADKHAAATAADAAKVATSNAKIAEQAADASRAVTAVDAHSRAMQGAGNAASGLSGKVNDVNNKMATGSAAAQRLSSQYQQTGNQAQTAAGKVQGLHTQVDGAASAAATASGKMSLFSGSVQHAGSMAATASGQVQALASSIAALQSKTITITTQMVTTLSHRAAGGPVAPGVPYLVGEEGRPEVFVPSGPGTILSGAQTAQVMSAAGVGQQVAGGGPDVVHLTADIHTHAYVDGREVFTSIKPEVFQWMKRNRGIVDGTWAPT